MSLKPFTMTQREHIRKGKVLTDQLSKKVEQAIGKSKHQAIPKRHHYIAGTPGIGKSCTVLTVAQKHKVPLIKIQGVASMSAIVNYLAVAAYTARNKRLYVWIDDCDSLFLDKDSLSVMKGALDEDRNVLSWNKNMLTQIQMLEKSAFEGDNTKAEALRFYQLPGSSGVEIPTDNMNFIITSNRFLTAPNSKLNTVRKMDEAAIRDRVVYSEYDLDMGSSWGWTAALVQSNDILELNNSDKHLLLDWMYTNWNNLPATSMRSVKELAADMINYPDSYPDQWEARLVRQN